MNSNYEKTLDMNFDKALELCSNSYSHEELIEFLKSGNIPEKQYSALQLEKLNSQEDAQIFLSNLINCDGKIREAVTQKFSEFVENQTYREYFANHPDILAKSTIDINANISRMVIDGLATMKEFENFGQQYANTLVTFIEEAFDGLNKIIYKDKKYTINKQMFKLYWCLEGLNHFYKHVPKDKLKYIIETSLSQTEYTVREKAAQLLCNNDLKLEFAELYEKISTDENYYVRQFAN